MSSVSISHRRKAFADAAAAKQRRQKILAIAGGVLLLAILAYEVPHTLKLLKGSSTGSATPATASAATPSTASPTDGRAMLRALRQRAPVNPFSGGVVAAGQATFGRVANPPGVRDPFAASGSSAAPASSAATTTTTPVNVLPKQIVIGQPGGGRVASHGWIVILASVPTGQGRSSATQIAAKARSHGLTFVSILNSSNSRPLRGGYWVVYTGPYPALSAVTSAAKHVHSSGFGDAYIRELVVYKSTAQTKTSTKKPIRAQ